jgi:nucleoid DNA-binding protein
MKKCLNIRSLSRAVREKTGISIKDSNCVLQAALNALMDGLASGNEVHLRGFGTFFLVKRNARYANSQPTAKSHRIKIPPTTVVTFKPSNELKNAVAKLATHPSE